MDPTSIYHGERNLQLYCSSIYYNEATDGNYAPPVILVNLEPRTMDSIWPVFRPEKICFWSDWGREQLGQGLLFREHLAV